MGLNSAVEWRAAQVRAARELGYDAVALSGVGGAGHVDSGPAGNGGTMEYDLAAIHQAAVQDEVSRLSLLMQGRRPGPARPEYAGLKLTEPLPAEEPDEDLDDLVRAATLELAGRTGNRLDYNEAAAAVDELVALGDPDGVLDQEHGIVRSERLTDPAARAAALIELSGMLPGAGDDEVIGLARRRESDRIARRKGAMPDEAETAEEEVDSIVKRHRDMLSHAPREGRAVMHVNSDRYNYDRYGEPIVDRITGRQPAKGGVMHPEVERLAREHGLYLGPPAGNERYEVPSARERKRQERRARPGHQAGMFSIEELHRGAMRSALSSRG
jgi:hypothetical protein